MPEHDVERHFRNLSPEEQQALLAALGEPHREYEPIHPRGTDWRGLLRKLWAPIAAVIGVTVKFGFLVLKFFGIFISVGAYALLWGWKFGVGFVVLILVHELGHFVAARLQGLDVSLPTFVPFFGAYVTIRNSPRDPWRNSLVALAGPVAGSLGAAVCWALAEAYDSRLLFALAYVGFLLNLINLVPVGFFDGGAVARAFGAARRAGRPVAFPIGALYVLLVVALVAGMVATHVPQHRL